MSIDFDIHIDYYKVLDIDKNSDAETIKSAYRNIIRNLKAHPDLGGSHENAVLINTAYKILSDKNTRINYDKARFLFIQNDEHNSKLVICVNCGSHNIISGEITERNICGRCGEHFIEKNGGVIHSLLPSPDIQLDTNTTDILNNKSEVIISLISIETVRHCFRCGKSWEIKKDSEKKNLKCPECKSSKWSDFRLFKCRFCERRFVTVDLYHWAYKIYPSCPYCKKRAWNIGSEKNPLKWLLSKLSGV